MSDLSSIKAILFDKDGTLIDFHDNWLPAYRRLADELAAFIGQPELADQLLALGGMDRHSREIDPHSVLVAGSNAEVAELFAQIPAIGAIPDLLEKVETAFFLNSQSQPIPVCDLSELFQDLRAKGIALGVATMDSEAGARATLGGYGVLDHLAFICGYDSGHGIKPEPGMIQAFARVLQVPTHEVLMVGDSLHDMEMAQRAGARAAGVLTGPMTRADLAPRADIVLESIAELPKILC